MSRFKNLPGTRDYYPDEMRVRRTIENRWREVALRYGFQEYDAPVIEPLELYTGKSGEEIVRQLYTFEDRGQRRIALRPEMTPSLARMIAARSQGLPKPIKWFSIPRLFRYERPQRGRFREFWQLNLDILGVTGLEADAEIIAAGVDTLRAFGLTSEDFEVRYSDRRLLDTVLDSLEIPVEQRPPVYGALDKLIKVGTGSVVAEFEKLGVPKAKGERLIDALQRRDLAGLSDILPKSRIDAEVERIAQMESYLDAYRIRDFCVFDTAIVRGLAYYTGIVFEMYDRGGELRAICGGGRYDDLLAAFGGQPMPATGFGLGEAILIELLDARDKLPGVERRIDAYVIPISDSERRIAIEVVSRVREAGLRGEVMLTPQSLAKGLRSAVQNGARAAVMIGERERESGQFTLRELETGQEQSLTISEVIDHLQALDTARRELGESP